MGSLVCSVIGHKSGESGEEQIEKEMLWRNVCIYWCSRCEGLMFLPGRLHNESERERMVEAAEEVLADTSEYNKYTVEAAEWVEENLAGAHVDDF